MNRFAIILLFFATTFSISASIKRLENPLFVRMNNVEMPLIMDATQVDSITFSYMNLDSIICSTIQSQLIWTPDTTYIIPLNNLSEVQFETPSNNVRNDIQVVEIDSERMKYIHSCDITFSDDGDFTGRPTIYFSNDMPENLRPHPNEIWVYNDFNERFPYGFLGRHLYNYEPHKISINLNSIVSPPSVPEGCFTSQFEICDISDAYENYFSSYEFTPEMPSLSPEEISTYSRKDTVDIQLPWYKLDVSHELELKKWKNAPIDLSINGAVDFEVGTRVGIKVITNKLVENGKDITFVDITGTHDVSVTGNVSLSGSISKDFQISPDLQARIPVAPLVVLGLGLDIGLELSGQLSFCFSDAIITSHYGVHFAINGDDRQLKSSFRPEIHLNKPKAYGEGAFSVGPKFNIYIGLLTRKLASLGTSLNLQGRVSINAPLSLDMWNNSHLDTRLYSALSDPESFKVDLVGGIEIVSKAFGNKNVISSLDLINIPILRKPILPKFSEVSVLRKNTSLLEVKAIAQNYKSLAAPLFNMPDYIGFKSFTCDKPELAEFSTKNFCSKSNDYEYTYIADLPSHPQDKSFMIYPYYQPFLNLGIDKIVLCEPFDQILNLETNSRGKFKEAYLAVYNNPHCSYDFNYMNYHLVYDVDFPEFDFTPNLDDNTEEWGWFYLDSGYSDDDIHLRPDEDVIERISEIAAYDLEMNDDMMKDETYANSDHYTFYNKSKKHIIRSKKVVSTTRECINIQFKRTEGCFSATFNSDGVIGFYKKNFDSTNKSKYEILWIDRCPLSYREFQRISFANLSVTKSQPDNGYDGIYDIDADVLFEGQILNFNDPENYDSYDGPYAPKLYFSGGGENTADSVLVNFSTYNERIVKYFDNYEFTNIGDFMTLIPNRCNEYFKAWKMKSTHHFGIKRHLLYTLDPRNLQSGILIWKEVITANQKYKSNILANHLWFESEVYKNPITYIVSLRKFRTCIRPVGMPFDHKEEIYSGHYKYHYIF